LASFVALAASACGIYADQGDDECDLRPLESTPASWRIGVQKALATLCAATVEVDGRTYYAGGGRWLDEKSLVLEEYGRITRANYRVADPTVFALHGVDPLAVVLMRGDGSADDLGDGLYTVLTGEGYALPASICPYADPADPGYPNQQCPLQTGRTYSVQLDFRCGYEAPVGPYGGAYWLVIDPPVALASGQPPSGLSYGADPGEIELQDADHMTFRSELGGELQLERIDDPDVSPAPCQAQWL
jgi:hypothetical protein